MAENAQSLERAEEGERRYANYFKGGHNAFEVILEFGQYYEGDSVPLIHTRIVTTPAYAKTFLEVLQEVLERYQSAFGPVGPGKANE